MEGFRVGPGSACRVRVDVHTTVVTWGFGEGEAVTLDSVPGELERGMMVFIRRQFDRGFTVIPVRQTGWNSAPGQRSYKCKQTYITCKQI